jgi:hypothetical protein
MRILAMLVALLSLPVLGQDAQLGYAFPGGAQRGSEQQIVLGGQNLGGPQEVYISGEGVEVSVVTFLRTVRNLNTEQRYLAADALMNAWLGQLEQEGLDADAVAERREQMIKGYPWNVLKNKDLDLTAAKMPPHPLLQDLESRSLAELIHARQVVFFPNTKLQLNRQLGELVLLTVRVAPDAPLGRRELRLRTRQKLTNPIVFEIGDLPEVRELEPNDTAAHEIAKRPALKDLIEPSIHELPVLLNGTIMPGDIDRFRFRAKAGQHLVADVAARRLVPFLADAVPGWFQAVVAIYDSAGKELAYADDHGINPDPRLEFQVPADCEYEIGIRDAIYRGRDDFVYRIDLRELRETKAPAKPAPPPEWVKLPSTLEGQIATGKQVDRYRIDGKAGQRITAEVIARQDGSPLDALLRLRDAEGKVLAWNDDHISKDEHLHLDPRGTTTHHADPYLMTTLPAKGSYFIEVSDAQGHGGPEHRYRLRLAPATPDFALRATPASLHFRPGERQAMCIYVLRKNGFAGPVKLSTSEGFSFAGNATIPAGEHSVWVTIVGPTKAPPEPVALHITGQCGELTREAVAADRVMQAFLYEHLLPAEQLLCYVLPRKWAEPKISLARDEVVRLAPGERATVTLKMQLKPEETLDLKLLHGPEGLSATAKRVEGGAELQLALADDAAAEFAGNAIFEGFREVRNDNKPKRWSIGAMPAIPLRIAPHTQ